MYESIASTLNDNTGPSRPLSVEQIADRAQNYDYNPLIPLKYWLRTAGTLLKEADIYEREGNDQQTYLLLFRHAQLVVSNLSEHPDAKQPENRKTLAQAKKQVSSNLQKLETLKPRINKRYERFEELIKARDARRASRSNDAQHEDPIEGTENKTGPSTISSSDPALSRETEALTADEHRDLAVRLAHKEIRRRATARKATRQAGIPEEVENERRTAGLWGNWEQAFTHDNILDRDTLSQQIQTVRSQINGSSNKRSTTVDKDSHSRQRGPRFQYPAVPDQHRSESRRVPSFTPDSADSTGRTRTSPSLQPPPPPPKDFPPQSPRQSELSSPTQNGFKNDMDTTRRDSAPTAQDLKPTDLVFKPSAYLENGAPLRTIFLPPDLRLKFLDMAQPNTTANLETCGILCGTLISNALFVSKLVIPEQTSTSDTCETVNESELFDYVDGEDLMVLGWIHTHPTQTCFMSSRDLHTHGGYQVMMPESIAIVCAPSKGEWGVFRLTDPPGMKSILNCTQTGLFHPHAEANIYTDALRPGHVFEAKGLEFEVVDLRP